MRLPAPSFLFHWHFIWKTNSLEISFIYPVELTPPNTLCSLQQMGTQRCLLWWGALIWHILILGHFYVAFCLGTWSRAFYVSKIPNDVNRMSDVSARLGNKAISEFLRALQVQITETTPGIFLPLWLRNNVLQIFADFSIYALKLIIYASERFKFRGRVWEVHRNVLL